jgi:SAM-dependent methyltransferase
MDFTGERPSLDQEVEGSRLRYKSILPYVINKIVLDYGCGIGLGTHMMGFFAKSVLGFDANKTAVEEACNNFFDRNIAFTNSFSTSILKYMDIVVLVEVIEHIEKYALPLLLADFSKKIPEIACTTPDGITMPYQPKTIQERRGFHVWHYTIDELKELFKKYYSFVEVYGHLFDPRINKYTSYVIYGNNKIEWDDRWLKDAKYSTMPT